VLKKQKMELLLSHKVSSISRNENLVNVLAYDKNEKEVRLEGDYCLISIGRRPYTEGLNLKAAGLGVNEKGQIEINKNMQTQVDNIYAIGDVVRGAMLAHKAEEEGVLVSEFISGQKPHIDYNLIPGVVYTWPEVAAVGKTEEELKNASIQYKVGKFPFTANAKATVMQETEGFVKIISDYKTDEILGVHIVGADAGNLIAELVVAMEFGASAEDLARTCHAHPTLTESIKEAALNVDNSSIHI